MFSLPWERVRGRAYATGFLDMAARGWDSRSENYSCSRKLRALTAALSQKERETNYIRAIKRNKFLFTLCVLCDKSSP